MLTRLDTLPLILLTLVACILACRPDTDERAEAPPDLPLRRSEVAQPRAKLSADLQAELETADPEQSLGVLVELSAQLDLHALGARLSTQGVGRKQRRDTVVTALRRVAAWSQTRLRPVLDRLGRRGWVDSYRGFTVVNSMAVVATPPGIREIARQEDVVRIALETREPIVVLAQIGEARRPAAAAGSWGLDAIGAQTAWNQGLDGAGVVVGIIDAGASAVHEQLHGNFRGGTESWYDPTGEHSRPQDGMTGHGTQILSAAVGQNLAGRVLGVAPGAEWVACAGLPGGRYDNVAFMDCADWMLNTSQPDVLINAWVLPDEGCERSLERIVDAWRAAEILPVFSAGNFGPDMHTDRSPANYVGLYPASAAAMSVGGLAQPDSAFTRSSRGPNSCDGSTYPTLVAPALGVAAAFPLAPSTYILSEGTSIAAGLVAGAAALLLQRYPEAWVSDLEDALRSGAIDLGDPGPDDVFGYGRLWVPGALDSLGRFLDLKERPNSSRETATQR